MNNARSAPINPDNFVRANEYLSEGETLDLGAGSIDLYDHTLDFDEDFDPDTLWNLEETPLPFDDGEFENVVAIHVLEHLENDLEVLEEMKRIASETVLIIVPIGERPETDDHERELDKDEWIERFEPEETDLSQGGPYWDLICVWRFD